MPRTSASVRVGFVVVASACAAACVAWLRPEPWAAAAGIGALAGGVAGTMFRWSARNTASRPEATEASALQAMEATARQQAQALEDLYNEAPCGYHSLDAQGVLVRVNDAELRWLGRTRDEVIGRPITDFLSAASAEVFKQRFPVFKEQGLLQDLELEFVRRDGSRFPVLVSASAIRDAEGRFVGTRSVLVDYTRLRQQQATLRRVLAASPMAVRVASLADHRVLFLNRAFCELVHRDEASARSMDISRNYVDPAVFAEIVDRLRAGESVLNRLVELHLPEQPEVPRVWALASYMVIEYDGQPAVLAWLFDVTELQRARHAAEAASRAKSLFLANMSHEIRTPMNAVLGLTHLALRDERDDVQRQRLEQVQTASRHLLQVINDILDLSKIESGRMVLEARAFDLRDVVRRVLALVRPRAEEKGLTLQVDLDHTPTQLLGDPMRLAQVLINLLGNAVKFTSTGGVQLRAFQQHDGDDALHVRFEVQDTGPGIPVAQQAHLFEPFEQGDASNTRLFGGTGLGLALTRQLTRLMGGACGVHSVPGQGSTFWFSAVFAKAEAPHAGGAAPAADVEEDAELQLRRRHAGALLLLAEDNPVNQEVAVSLLRAAGLDVVCAGDGQAAVAMALQRDHALILMDMQMPVMDGLQAARRIRAAVRTPPPIIAMTANAFGDDRAACVEAGMCDHLAKPVDPHTLYATVLRWLDAEAAAHASAAPQARSPADTAA